MSEKECQSCESSKQLPSTGGPKPAGRFNTNCLQCCVRLVQSARPSWDMQGQMLEYIATHPDAPKREEIIAAMKLKKG